MSVKITAEHHFEFLSLTGGCRGLSESTLAKIPHCWKSHVTAHMLNTNNPRTDLILYVFSDAEWSYSGDTGTFNQVFAPLLNIPQK